MKKVKNIWKYLNPQNLRKDINAYGYQYRLSQHVLLIAGVLLGLVVVGRFLNLGYMAIGALGVVFILTLPFSVRNVYVNLFEQKKFIDVSNYVEQFLYSFKRQSKILSALEDTLILYPSGMMHDKIEAMIAYLQYADDSEGIYENAFAIMEEEYSCEIVNKIHAFVTNVELYGGEYESSADILISDRNKWVNRVVEAQEMKKKVTRNMTLSVVLSMGIVAMMCFVVPDEFTYLQALSIAQVVTWCTIVVNYLLWLYVSCRLAGSWITVEHALEKEEVERMYEMALEEKEDKNPQIIRGMLVSILVAVTWLLTKDIRVVGGVTVIGFFIFNEKKRKKKRAMKKLRREVEKAFPEWMMSISLLLQTDNVQVSIDKSMKDAPIILQMELRKLMEKIEVNPVGILPYLEFYEELKIEDIQSAMKMLYAMSQYGSEDISKQIYAFVERNSAMQDRSEKMKMEDYLAGIGFFILLPMLIGSLKLMVDMGLLIMGLLSQTQGVM